jgi:glycosyltransferase involved in cell wall biosynthesis
MLHIINACFVGRYGLADYTLSLARALEEFSVSEIITSEDFSYPSVKFGGQVTRLFRRTRHYPIDLILFIRYIIQKRPDVVVRMFRLFGITVATTVHDVLPHYPRAWSALEFSFFYKSFDCLIAHSSDAEKKLRLMGVVAPIRVIPHGVYDIYNVSGFTKSAAREKLGCGIGSADFVGLFFGIVDERKGVRDLISVMQKSNLPSGFRLLIAGANGIPESDTSLQREFFGMISSDNCTARIERIPFGEVELYFSACDFVLVPYIEGTTSGVVKLAMAFSKPVVASDIGDLPETIEPGAGIIISHKRIKEELPIAIGKIKDQYQVFLSKSIKQNERYSWSAVGRDYYDFISQHISIRKIDS